MVCLLRPSRGSYGQQAYDGYYVYAGDPADSRYVDVNNSSTLRKGKERGGRCCTETDRVSGDKCKSERLETDGRKSEGPYD